VIDHELTRVAVGVELIVALCNYTFFALVIWWNIIKHVSRAINIGSVIQSVTRLSYSDNLRAVIINRVFASECRVSATMKSERRRRHERCRAIAEQSGG